MLYLDIQYCLVNKNFHVENGEIHIVHNQTDSKTKNYQEYKAKFVTHIVALPDDIAKALQNPEKRSEWDIFVDILHEKSSKFIFYRESESCCKILEIRNPDSVSKRTTLYEIAKIKGKPYYLRLTIYTTVTPFMQSKIDAKLVQNNLNCLKNYIMTVDSMADISISLSNIKNCGDDAYECNPTITITDLLAEIEEIDVAEDGISENEEESLIRVDLDDHSLQKIQTDVQTIEAKPDPVQTQPEKYEIAKETVSSEDSKDDTDKQEEQKGKEERTKEDADLNKGLNEEKNQENLVISERIGAHEVYQIANEIKEEVVIETKSTPVQSAPPPSDPIEEVKTLSPDEQFQLDLSNAPKSEQIYIQKAYDSIGQLFKLASDKGWDKSEEKDGFSCYFMDSSIGLK